MLTNEGDKYSVSEARYIEGAMDVHNTFEAPEVVDEKDFTAYENSRRGLCLKIFSTNKVNNY